MRMAANSVVICERDLGDKGAMMGWEMTETVEAKTHVTIFSPAED